MEQLLAVYLMVLSLTFVLFLIFRLRNNETVSRKYAKIRVPVDDRRRGSSLPREGKGNNTAYLDVLIVIAAFFILLAIINGI